MSLKRMVYGNFCFIFGAYGKSKLGSVWAAVGWLFKCSQYGRVSRGPQVPTALFRKHLIKSSVSRRGERV